MKYYLVAGEASGDLHASHLIAAIRQLDSGARFRCFGGEMMQAEGAELVQHYRDLAYMGFLPVLMHLGTILGGLRRCLRDIIEWQPHAVILVDYPGFNLKLASRLKRHGIRVFYYISPKVWAWKEHRVSAIKRDVDALLCILPFEVEYYANRHNYKVCYVGNPTVDEVDAFLRCHTVDEASFRRDAGLDERPVIALLAGSRRQEVEDNLRRMIEAAEPFAAHFQLVIAAAPGLDDAFYKAQTEGADGEGPGGRCRIVRGQTLRLLQHSTAALVTSGTATLETALLGVPQVVCYHMKAGRLASFARRLLLKIPYISLVNLVANEEVVPELIAEQMNPTNVRRHLADILPGGCKREAQIQGYRRMKDILGKPGAPGRAAKIITERLTQHDNSTTETLTT